MKRRLLSAFVFAVGIALVLALATAGVRASPETLHLSTAPAISQAGDGDTTLVAADAYTNTLANASFEEDGVIPAPWQGKKLTSKDKRVCNKAFDGSCSFLMVGTGAEKSLKQVVNISGSAGDTFTLSGLSKARKPLGKGGPYWLQAKVFHTDGTKGKYKICFTKSSHGWEYRGKTFTVAKDYNKMMVSLRYAKQKGKAWFDDVWLYKRYCTDGWQDDFSDPTSGWPIDDFTYLKLEYLAGEYHVLTKAPAAGGSVYFSTLPAIYATNFTLEVDGRSGLGVYGLVFGWHWGVVLPEWYSFELGPGKYWAIWKVDAAEPFGVVLDSGHSSYITSGMNHLKIVRQGSQIEAYVNGHLLSTVTDSSFLGSRIVGLTAGSLDTAPVDGYFDNFWVCPVDSAPGVGAADAAGVGEGIILHLRPEKEGRQ